MEKKVSVGMAKAGRSAAEEFLPVEIGKNDCDWLLTPPGTPLFSSVDSADHQPPPSSQRSTSNLRSSSLLKPSRLSALSENTSHGPRMARSSSTTRVSLYTSKTPSSVLNTSTASVNSRPTTPANRVRTPVTAIPRPTTSHSTTPARTRPAAEKPQPIVQISRPSTPTTRAHFPASSISSGPIPARPSSRPSTPTHQPPPPPPPPAPNSRLSSPARSRPSAQLTVSPNLPLDAPLNLRPISTGKQRAGMELKLRGNSKVEVLSGEMSSLRRVLSPAVARGRTADNPVKARMNGHQDGLKLAGNQKLMVTEKKVKPAMGGDSSGYGRTMSKISLNMAVKHMDSTSYEYTSMNSLTESKNDFWGVLARKAKAFLEDEPVAHKFETYEREHPKMVDKESVRQEGLTIMESKAGYIIQETKKLHIWKRGGSQTEQNQALNKTSPKSFPHIQADYETQLKASRDVRLQMQWLQRPSCLCER